MDLGITFCFERFFLRCRLHGSARNVALDIDPDIHVREGRTNRRHLYAHDLGTFGTFESVRFLRKPWHTDVGRFE